MTEIVRKNVFAGLVGANFRWTEDMVVEFNTLAGAQCIYDNATKAVTPISVNSSSNIGMVYRPL